MNQDLVEIYLRVRNIEAALDFYTNLSGFVVTNRREFAADKSDLIYLNPPGSSVQIELTYNHGTELYHVSNGFSD